MHPENTTAPPQVQDDHSEIRGFIYQSVCVEFEDLGFTQGFPPLLLIGLATELSEILAPLYPEGRIYIQACAGRADQWEEVSRSASRHKDLILSCRAAKDPGRTYLERMAMRRDGFAPQKPTSSKRGAGGAAC